MVGILAVLSVIAVSLSQRARIGTAVATSFLEETRDLYAIEAGMTSAIRALSAQPEFDHEGELHLQAVMGSRRLDILTSDESRKTDVNRASPAEIAKAFTMLGADSNSAEALSHRVIDWRDADDRPHAGGAEAADYLAAGALAIPRNESFVSLDEVEVVLGLPPEIAVRLHEKFTLLPSTNNRASASAAAIGLSSASSDSFATRAGDIPIVDGITRSADTAGGAELFGVQIRLRRAVGGRGWGYFRLHTGGGT